MTATPSSSEQSDAERREFIERRNRLEDSAKESQRTADKLVVSGAGGALILSITFIDVIARAPRPDTALVLLLAWAFLGFSLTLSFVSHYTSDRAFRYEIAKADAHYSERKFGRRPFWDRITGLLNLSASILLLLGLLFLARFAYSNTRFQTTASSPDSTVVRLSRIETLLDSIVARGTRPVPPPPTR